MRHAIRSLVRDPHRAYYRVSGNSRQNKLAKFSEKNAMNRFFGQNVLITGASSGIGLEIALEFGKLGANLFLIARNPEKLLQAASQIQEAYPSISLKTFSVDISDPIQIQSVIKQIGEKEGGIHTLINNAGILGLGLFESNSIQDLKRTMETNYFGAVYATQAAWPYLIESQKGHIGFVSSVAGYTGLIGYCAYSPTKFALTGLAECLRMEAKDHGIGVTIVYPPDTDTPMLKEEHNHTLPECKALSKNTRVLSPREVAQKFVKGILKYRFDVVCNTESKMARILRVLCPAIYFKIIDSIVEKDRRKRQNR